MIFKRLIAFPESRHILVIHMLATPFLAMQGAVVAMVPVLLRNHFAAGEWQTAVSTAAIPIMSLLTIFWNEVYRRMSQRSYLLTIWAIAILPLAGIALCHRPLTVLVFVVISASGFGAITPFTADILRNCYPPGARSKIFSVLQVLAQSTLMVAAYAIGVWLKIDAEAFRRYLPVSVAVIAVGMWLLHRISRQPLFNERHRLHPTEPLRASLLNASRNMVRVLARDRRFRRYEIAFFIYGTGWMICNALLPFLMVDVLDLNYEEIARATQTTFQLTLLVMMFPTGHLMDRHGPIRTSGWAFGIVAFYPIGLMLAGGVNGLMLTTLCFGVGICGVQLAWTIGPVTLARDASQAPHYLAIHATLVGARAVLGQFPAVALYKLTGDIRLPLLLSCLLFACGSLLMSRLGRDSRAAEPVPPSVLPLSPEHTRMP